MTLDYCTFCGIIEGRLTSRKAHEEDGILVFHNQLDWAPVMLLIVPKVHMSQAELWISDDLFPRMADLAVNLGHEFCPNGFRVLSNFGQDGLQTQTHGHLHVIGGRPLGLYMNRSGSTF